MVRKSGEHGWGKVNMLLDAGWRGDEDEDCFLRAGNGGRWEMARFGLVRRESVPGMGGSGVGAVEKGEGGGSGLWAGKDAAKRRERREIIWGWRLPKVT